MILFCLGHEPVTFVDIPFEVRICLDELNEYQKLADVGAPYYFGGEILPIFQNIVVKDSFMNAFKHKSNHVVEYRSFDRSFFKVLQRSNNWYYTKIKCQMRMVKANS